MTEEKFMSLAKAKYADINALNDEPTMLDYEQGLVDILQEFGREIVQANLDGGSTDRRKKRDISPPSEPSK